MELAEKPTESRTEFIPFGSAHDETGSTNGMNSVLLFYPAKINRKFQEFS
jgi:hypothetical protein